MAQCDQEREFQCSTPSPSSPSPSINLLPSNTLFLRKRCTDDPSSRLQHLFYGALPFHRWLIALGLERAGDDDDHHEIKETFNKREVFRRCLPRRHCLSSASAHCDRHTSLRRHCGLRSKAIDYNEMESFVIELIRGGVEDGAKPATVPSDVPRSTDP
ncbi:hypothetical protein EVAR_46176_1 [Eumeta japonica]|uniref:Uncharacterized protein n=1 Tax=Eumeta variegata TaxID=151549 RepID=A0A4C1Y2T6_EUMVA|nr:hypothetical protein EVAR_46176_1 [Eumeta japonica]